MPLVAAHQRYGASPRLVHAALARLAALLALVWLAGMAFAGEARAQERTVLAFGDSLTAGYQLKPGKGFAPRLQEALTARGMDVTVINAGVSGDTSAAGRRRIEWTLDNLEQTPDLMILELGANDMLRGLDPRETLRNLNAIIEEAKGRGIDVLLAGMLGPPNMGEDNRRYFNAVYPFLANRHDLDLYPFFLNGVIFQRQLLLPDNLHPNADGVEAIVRGILPSVEAALRKAS